LRDAQKCLRRVVEELKPLIFPETLMRFQEKLKFFIPQQLVSLFDWTD